MVGLFFLVALVTACLCSLPYWMGAPLAGASGHPQSRYTQQNLGHIYEKPALPGPGGTGYLLGSDALGRSLLGRLLVGGVISLGISLASALIAVVLGATVGLLAGYVGGRTDALLMRTVDVLYGLPYILLVILMRVALVPPAAHLLGRVLHDPAAGGPLANVLVLLGGIGAVSWLTMARVIRGQVLALKGQPFIEAAWAMGVSPAGILWRHLLPNLVSPILVYATLTVPQAILSESFLSFLGLGIQSPLPSWGNLASEGTDAFNPVHSYWWLILWPCVALSLTLLSLNFVGEGLRDALDPKAR